MNQNGCRILLVDDHAPVRQALRNLLAPCREMQVIGEAEDGKQAVEMVASCRPDIVLLDINMPYVNGIEAASVIKHSWSDTVIIGLCVVQDTYTIDAFMRAGAMAVISKDRFDQLYATLQRVCSLKNAAHS